MRKAVEKTGDNETTLRNRRVWLKTLAMSEPFQPADAKRFEAALRRFDGENARDPNTENRRRCHPPARVALRAAIERLGVAALPGRLRGIAVWRRVASIFAAGKSRAIRIR